MTHNFCPFCGTQVVPGSRFCGSCGRSIVIADEHPAAPAPQPSQKASESTVQSQPTRRLDERELCDGPTVPMGPSQKHHTPKPSGKGGAKPAGTGLLKGLAAVAILTNLFQLIISLCVATFFYRFDLRYTTFMDVILYFLPGLCATLAGVAVLAACIQFTVPHKKRLVAFGLMVPFLLRMFVSYSVWAFDLMGMGTEWLSGNTVYYVVMTILWGLPFVGLLFLGEGKAVKSHSILFLIYVFQSVIVHFTYPLLWESLTSDGNWEVANTVMTVFQIVQFFLLIISFIPVFFIKRCTSED